MNKTINSGSFSTQKIELEDFRTGFEIAQEKNIDFALEKKAIEALKKAEEIYEINTICQEIRVEEKTTKKNEMNNMSDSDNLVVLKNIDSISEDAGIGDTVIIEGVKAIKPTKSGIFHENNGSTTTTTTLKNDRINPWRLGKITLEICKILNDCGGLTSIEIARKINKTNNYVTEYLLNLKKYGIVFRNNENWKWYFEPIDDDLRNSILYIIYNNKTTTKQKKMFCR